MTTPVDVDALISGMPPAVAGRIRQVGGVLDPSGSVVLCWLRQAVRDHDNPALDAALLAARALGIPVLVYQGLDERHPYASDRLHRIQLEGARDLCAGLAAQGVPYALHVARRGHRGPHLRTLAGRAALVVTEDVPVQPLEAWTRSLAEDPGVAVWSVDAHCILPMNAVHGRHDRAFAFRRATEAARDEALRSGWEDAPRPGDPSLPIDLPFEPVDPRTACLSSLIAACDIDHTIPPVWDTPGGSRPGYARWRGFLSQGLSAYARRRNDAADPGGVSGMSAYLHFGHVSPWRIAGDAVAHGGPGADKFLDELLVWREFAWHLGRRHPSPDWDVLPSWARASLEAHVGDPRPALHSWETLARGRTGVTLWDLAQTSLRRHGALHNNVRMTWGKAFVHWTRDPRRALRLMVDLNHRYALDGRDPSSHLGLLWCLGLADRPFDPPTPVTGRVRDRDVEGHASRLDLDAFRDIATRPRRTFPVRTVVVGGGLAGLACARTLRDQGEEVLVLDKARGPGGRTATRRGEGIAWDHGAPRLDLSMDDPRLDRVVASWLRDGVVAPFAWQVGRWRGGAPVGVETEPSYVAVGAANRLAKHLASEVSVEVSSHVGGLQRVGGGWSVRDREGRELARADRVVLAVPAAQAVPLVQPHDAMAAERLESVRWQARWTALVRGTTALPWDVDGVRFSDHPVLGEAWRIDRLPGREGSEAWVIHGSDAWSTRTLEQSAEEASEALVGAWSAVVGVSDVEGVGHRWRYGRVLQPVGGDVLGVGDDLVVCGDGVAGDGVSSALRSGFASAGWILGR